MSPEWRCIQALYKTAAQTLPPHPPQISPTLPSGLSQVCIWWRADRKHLEKKRQNSISDWANLVSVTSERTSRILCRARLCLAAVCRSVEINARQRRLAGKQNNDVHREKPVFVFLLMWKKSSSSEKTLGHCLQLVQASTNQLCNKKISYWMF